MLNYKIFILLVCLLCAVCYEVFATQEKQYNFSPKIWFVPLSLKQSIDMAVSKHIIISRYKLHNKQWKIALWHQTKFIDKQYEWKHISGGGIETPFITAGNFYEYGLFKNFNDISNTQAWNSVPYQYSRWSIRTSPVDNADVGLLLSLPNFPLTTRVLSKDFLLSFWIVALPLSSEETNFSMFGNLVFPDADGTIYNKGILKSNYHTGMSIGYKFAFWEPRVLYKYSWRNELPLTTTNWSSWILVEPSILQLHQLQFAQKFYFKKFAFIELIGLMSASDSIVNQYSGKALLKFYLDKVEFSMQVAGAESYNSTDEWKYAKYLWNTSVELLYFYTRHARIRARANVAEYNINTTVPEYPQNIFRTYSIKWSHLLQKKKMVVSMEPELEYAYFFTIDDEYHRSVVEMVVYYDGWKFSLRNKVDWYITEKSRELHAIDFSHSLYSSYVFDAIPITLWARITLVVEDDMNTTYDNVGDNLYDSLEDIISEIGIKMKYKGFLFSCSFDYEISEDSSVTDSKQFKNDWFIQAKFQYNW